MSEQSSPIGIGDNVFLILTNIGFLFVAILCFWRSRTILGLCFLNTTISSSLYHLCKWGAQEHAESGGYCIPGLSFEMYYAMDFFSSQLLIPATVGLFIRPNKPMILNHRTNNKSNEYKKRDNVLVEYSEASPAIINHLWRLECLYILSHVFLISVAEKVVGPSIIHVTIPLLVFNSLIVWLLMLSSWLSLIAHYVKLLDKKRRKNIVINVRTCAKKLYPVITHTRPEEDWSFKIANWINYQNNCLKRALSKRFQPLLEIDVIASTQWEKTDLSIQNVKSTSSSLSQSLTILEDTTLRKKKWILISFVCGAVGTILFSTQGNIPTNVYPWTHGIWHLLGALGYYIQIKNVLTPSS